MNSDRQSIAVLGLGPMGQAMASAWLAAGHDVTAWARTPSRADGVVGAGAVFAATPGEAVAAGDVVVLSLTDYQAMYDVLDGAVGGIADKVLVNLSSDAPTTTREAAVWAERHGARWLTGGVMVPAPMIGTEAAHVYYSGARDVFDSVAAAMAVIGAPRYVGADPGLGQLYYQAQLDVFLTTLASLLHAVALVGSAGVPAATFVPEALANVAGIPQMLGGGDDVIAGVDSGEHPGELSTTTMMGATAQHIVAASEAAGIDLALPRAVASLYERAIEAGHGADNWTSLIEVIRPVAAA